MDGLNAFRVQRVADVLSDFQKLQYYIAAAPVEPPNMDDYYTEGWAMLRACSLHGQHILNCAADITVQTSTGGPEEQDKAELKHVLLDAYARRHEGQKIYLRQAAAQRWIGWREQILQGGRPDSGNHSPLRACDLQLQAEVIAITDEIIYEQLKMSDDNMGRWTSEDPSLRAVQRWVRARRQQ